MGLSAKFGSAATVDKNYYKVMESSVYKTMSRSVAGINGFFSFRLSAQSSISSTPKQRSVF